MTNTIGIDLGSKDNTTVATIFIINGKPNYCLAARIKKYISDRNATGIENAISQREIMDEFNITKEQLDNCIKLINQNLEVL